jgi:pyridoxine 4-dehydrogenase
VTALTFELGGRPIRRMGYGAMQLPGPGVMGPPRDRRAALDVLRAAVRAGVDHVDTAQFYGPDVANDLIREALHPFPEGLRIVTKVGVRRGEDGSWNVAARADELRDQIEANLRSLGVERLALVNLRLAEDPAGRPPLEESLGALVELQDEGKIELLGLSNVTVEQLDAGARVGEIAGVQDLYNLLDRTSEPVLEACRDRGLAFVPFFPLGSAFTGGPARIAETPAVAGVARRHGVTPAQVALAWLLHAALNVLLIPGTSSADHLAENLAAADLELDEDDMSALDGAAG